MDSKRPQGHRNPLRHLFNMYGYFLLGATIMMVGRVGITASSMSAALMTIATSASIALAFGLLTTIGLRAVFSLTQTGRVIQYLFFWAGGTVGVLASAKLFGVVATSPLLAGFVLFAVAFAVGTAMLEIPIRGRTWMPRRAPKKSDKK